jgi:hypothetical protein
MNALTKALERSRAMTGAAHDRAVELKQAGILSEALTSGVSTLDEMRSSVRDRQRYSLYRGWLYSAVHALSLEAAGQPVNVGRMSDIVLDGEERRGLSSRKAHFVRTMGGAMRKKAMQYDVEIVENDPMLRLLHQPNPFQYVWQFVYSFVANLNLTGWSYIVGGESDEGGLEFWSLPTTWVRPNKDFTQFKIVNPKNPTAESTAKPLPRENVAWAYIPDPSDPLSAYAPAASQMQAVRIDDHMQASQQRFFENGIFPSAVVTVGKNPHPDVAGGIRPRLSGAQRRQVNMVIRKAMSGVANYGNPAIVDGMIEKIERLSMTQTEMGWDKSEDKVRTRLLSAFGVHPFILGEPVGSQGHAQAFQIDKQFCKRVNVFLEMLDVVMTCFVENFAEGENKPIVWWDKCIPVDESLRSKELIEGRKNNDITRNEYRARQGLPPVEESEERSKLLDTVGGMNGTSNLLDKVAQGAISMDVAASLLSRFLQIPEEEMREIVGVASTRQTLESAVDVLRTAVEEMRKPVEPLRLGLSEVAEVGAED